MLTFLTVYTVYVIEHLGTDVSAKKWNYCHIKMYLMLMKIYGKLWFKWVWFHPREKELILCNAFPL